MKEENFRYTIEDNPNIDVGYLSKPTTTISSPDIDFKYVPIINEQGDTQRMLAGDLGKNVANSKLTSVAGAGLVLGDIWSIKTNGFPFRIEDLPDETGSPIPAGKLMVRDDGTFVVNKKADITITIPEEFRSTGSVLTTTINVNHIFPTKIPETPSFAEDLKRIMADYKNIEFTSLNSGWRVFTKGGLGTNLNRVDGTGLINIRGVSGWANDGDKVVEIANEVGLPSDKDWIVKMNGQFIENYSDGFMSFGLKRKDALGVEFSGKFHTDWIKTKQCIITITGNNSAREIDYNFIVLFVKTGGVITIIVYSGSQCFFSSMNANIELGDLYPCIILKSNGESHRHAMKADFKYKILN